MTLACSRRRESWRPLLGAAVAVSAALPLAAQEPQAEVEAARFHHIHLNVTDPGRSIDFYRATFGAVPIEFRGVADAVYTERSFILFTEVEEAPDGSQRSGIWHFGWGGVDLPSQYRWLVSRGVDIHTPIYRLGRGHVIYVNGPDREMIELNTMGHHRFAHVHLFAADVNETAAWYERHFGLRARRTAEGNPRPVGPDAEFATWEEFHREHRAWSNAFRADNVTFIVYNLPDYEPVAPWWPPEDAAPLLETRAPAGPGDRPLRLFLSRHRAGVRAAEGRGRRDRRADHLPARTRHAELLRHGSGQGGGGGGRGEADPRGRLGLSDPPASC